MRGKTKVRMLWNDPEHGDWIEGEEGYIDGYVMGSDYPINVVVVIGNKVIACKINQIEVITDIGHKEKPERFSLCGCGKPLHDNRSFCDDCLLKYLNK